ncbi:hypothetical protein KKF81_07060 [Candidatus Micrarchaeota archaeon]|nr:hypothetical protein [Candidatus Micrarchaeota archaeon]MBU1166690.1 hypothetical protein [Candidatus Micrarchaeota archaeon]MBU1886115.1 hypothetical protein [Candidatus Micrarchaeota archaeon]
MAIDTAPMAVLFVFVILTTSCSSLTDLVDGNITDNGDITNGTDISLIDESDMGDETAIDDIEQPEVNVSSDVVWVSLTQNRFQDICKKDSKLDAGDYHWAILGCICENTTDDDLLKEYDCMVFTIEPSQTRKYVRFVCEYEKQTCLIDADQGVDKTWTLEEIYNR